MRPRDSQADFGTYRPLRKTISAWSLGIVLFAAVLLASRSPVGALGLATGGFCGVAYMWLVMHANERLAEHRRVGAFVFSSFLRLGVFAIVPVGLALRGPWWTMATYFAGFFTPLLLYMLSVQRAFRRS
ncbi:MAG: hypothetical protein DLM50_05025 [Candidatus Meridianibacter frigidus]|nr:MAG: hypothetical protein DLM50_05025 [Candidatus Eremiobacteraeota bacterium]